MNDPATPESSRITPVILSGGAGTRLWPLSRKARPKQMLALTGAGTMLATTAARVADPDRFAPPIVVAGAGQADEVEQQLAAAGTPAGTLIVEPEGRNTAPAIALAALSADEDALLLVMPSDHLIGDAEGFLEAIAVAAPLAEAGWLVTFGVRPTRAETGYGYIRQGRQIAPGAHEAERFVEKPDAATAAAYLAEGGYHWNAGIFLFRAGAYLDMLAVHAPDIAAGVREAMAKAETRRSRIAPDAQLFGAVRSQSIDHAVMEHAAKVAVVPVDMDWSDVGSWQALHDVSFRDESGNAVSGDALAIDCNDCLILSDGPLIAAIGVHDLAIVATPDAVLIVPRGDSQRVQEAVARLRKADDPRT
ncbi:MAG: mannose-1-phosphate guanylyltransferase/mannose-6-phosphate isomerase [Sphingomonadales bacterium]